MSQVFATSGLRLSNLGRRLRRLIQLALLALAVAAASTSCSESASPLIEAPRIWNDRDLAEWAGPVAGLSVRPDHFSEAEYYAGPLAEWVRTYPVYFPGREPAGYWEMIQAQTPEPLITPGPRSREEWIEAGRRVFDQMDVPVFRSRDPQIIATVRSRDAFEKLGGHPQADGTVHSLRWVPTSEGLALGINDCASCHTRHLANGTRIPGAPFNDPGDGVVGLLVAAGDKTFFGNESPAMIAWRNYGVPWVAGDIHEPIRAMSEAELAALGSAGTPGTFPRFNGSPFFMTKVPDLIGLGERKYIDHTATHRLRSVEDAARYATLVSCCDSAGFGPHQMLSPAQRRIVYRFTDDQTFALAQYLFALEPPPNPNVRDARADVGRRIFEREGCASCHTPPLYTSNKLTRADGYAPPPDHPYAADILPLSVGTDPNLALKTRKGTGLYKIPSLKGVWYRGLLGHDGSVASLEDWFDPLRLRDDYVPSGFKGYKVERRAVPGHPYGLALSTEDKAALIAFLRTL
jgi:mono/diheme cytochrome c family protein